MCTEIGNQRNDEKIHKLRIFQGNILFSTGNSILVH